MPAPKQITPKCACGAENYLICANMKFYCPHCFLKRGETKFGSEAGFAAVRI